MIQINNFNSSKIYYDYSEFYTYYFKLLPSSAGLNVNINLNDILNLGGIVIKDRMAGFGESERSELWIIFEYDKILITTTKFKNDNLNYVQLSFNCQFNYKETEIYKLLINNTIEQTFTKKLDFISNDGSGLGFSTFEFPEKPNNIELNYNDDFDEINKNIINDLSQKKSGLHLLHGIPGTGKTSYIKHLINTIDKRFIYCPSFMVTSLSSPEFITLMLDHGTNSILIIEDAEDALVSRDDERNSAVTNILNLGDGLIGDVANIQIIATFNTDLSNVDEALLRKGRTLNKYEFKRLEVNKLNLLKESLKLDFEITEPLTLAEFYNHSSLGFENNKKQNKIEIE